MLTQASRESALTVKLPFLALSRRTTNGPVPVECPGASGYALAFTTLIDAGAYLQEVQSGDLELELVFRQSLHKYLAALEQSGFLGIGFDASPDCARVTTFPLAELRATFSL
jgi:hypothetical protein